MNIGNYDYYVDDNGTYKAISRTTGEIVDAVEQLVPVGSTVTTPDAREAYRKYQQMQEKKAYRRAVNNELGNFFFIPSEEDFKGVLPQSVTRLIFLNTFMDYDNNKLMLTQRTPMQRSDLPEVLGISKSAVCSFWKEVSPKYLQEKEDGLIFTNASIFTKGKINRRKNFTPLQKFYIDGIRTLYTSTDTSNHKHLGYVFKMLPFINFEYNILCHNPDEQDLHSIESLSLAEFCDFISFDKSHLNRLLNIYKNLRFNVNGNQERFCAFTYDGLDKKDMRIFVNPRIIYNGSDYRKVEVLGAFCK